LLFLILSGYSMRFYRSAIESNSRRGSMSHMAIESFLFTFAGGGTLGFAAGFAIKRIIKIALVILGTFMIAITYISYKGIIEVDWDRAQHLTTSAAYKASEQVMNAINSTAIQLSAHPSVWQQQAHPITFGAGFIGGFLLGLKH
jgi:uncharacterized membrane protein (Fun14 family)